MDALSIGSAGMMAATQRFNASAQAVVSGQDDPVAGIVGMAESKTTFVAAAQVVKASDKMVGQLLDVLA